MRNCLQIAGLFLILLVQARAEDNTRPEFTPAIIQVQNGPTYDNFSEDGSMYCVPSSYTMDLFWLSHMGFTTLAPAYDYNNPGSAANLALTDNLDRVIAGLFQTGQGPRGGTTGANETAGFKLYLNLKGLSGSYENDTPNHPPTLADFANAFDATYKIAVINIGWYTQSSYSPTTYIQGGGHDVALVDYSGNSSLGVATINNPEPRSLYNTAMNIIPDARQSPTITNTDGLTLLDSNNQPVSGSYLQFITPEFTGSGPRLAVIQGLGNWSITATPGFTPATFTLTQNETVNTNGGSFSAEAPIDDAGNHYGITKTGLGTMTLTGNVTTMGNWAVNNGMLASTLSTDGVSSATPFGTGNMALSGGTRLLLHPTLSSATAGNRNVSLLLSSGTGSALSVEGGGAILQLDRGTNDSLSVTIGGNTSGSNPNLVLNDKGTLMIKSQDSISTLGSTTKLLVAGSAPNQPPLANGIVTPAILGQENDPASSGVFLTYSGAGGFAQAATTSGSSFSGTNVTTIFSTSADINLGSGTATIAALSTTHDISGDAGSTLNITPQDATDAGLILNGGNIAVANLSFGNRTGYIYSNLDGGTTSSEITAASLVTSGPGQTTLSANSAQINGPVYVNAGTLKVENQGTGSAPIVVQQNAILKVTGSIAGSVAANGGMVLLDGGTLSGNLALSDASTLAGNGTISYSNNMALLGNIGSTTEAGTLNFIATSGTPLVTVGEDAIFNFTLTSLTGNTAGTDWTYLVFNNNLNAPDGLTINLNFLAGTDPETSPDPDFWKNNHSWNFMRMTPTNPFLNDISGITLPEGNLFTTGKFNAQLDVFDGYQWVVVTYEAVPEPSTWILLGIGTLFIALRITHRRIVVG